MQRLKKPGRRAWCFTAAALALIGVGSGIWWEKSRRFPDHVAGASAAYSRGDWARTVFLVHRRLKEAPDDRHALRLAARAAARQDEDQKAVAIYHRLEAGAMDAEDFFLKGRSLSRTGQLVSANTALETALERDPDHPEALAALTGLCMRTDRFHAAEELAERLARQPEWEARAQVMLGTIRAETHDPAGAARALRRWWQLDPEGRAVAPYPVASIRKLLASSWLKSGQPAEARTGLETLLAAGPDPEASWLLSRCFIQERDWDRAAAALRQDPSYRAQNPLALEPAPYVGEARCASCHPEHNDAVLASRHATTFARARELGSLPVPKDPLPDPGNPKVRHRFRREGDSLVVETRADQKVWRAVVDYAFGSRDHYTTLVGRDDRDRSFIVRMSYFRSPRGIGWDLSTDLPRQPAEHEEYFGKKMVEGDGVRRCLSCHTTNSHSILHEVGPEAEDHSIGCESCHGPGGHHVAAVAAGFSDLAIVAPGEASPAAIDQICARCHSAHPPEGLDVPRTDRVGLRFQSLTLTLSRCFTESDGTVGCVTCHDPHRNAETSVARNEAKCLACHVPAPLARSSPVSTATPSASEPGTNLSQDKPAATRAKTLCPVNPAHGCLECHMPRVWTQSTQSFKTDHFIRVRDRSGSEGRATSK